MLRYDRIARFTHGLEDFLTRLRKGDLAVTARVTDKLLAAADALGTLVREAGEASPTSAVDLDESSACFMTSPAPAACRRPRARVRGGRRRHAARGDGKSRPPRRPRRRAGRLAVHGRELVARIGPAHGPLQERDTHGSARA